ncbi:diacylglycerol/polyprenol kinase family protein [Butyrivibrio sp. YAB3001]|uniref:diacylglycerol/polyprenol kinase family protein n=1 Tax=Butyrivibrio sp. YAB3001 TaxID=1520812 RepID=UPI0008F65382|nr:hypothetical protein [Butyrivibrio sp. YAB3001]SFB74047.1 Dolichol kinase [Butyrivibrio sp. YAB3001]
MSSYKKEVFRKTLHVLGLVGAVLWVYSVEDYRQSIWYTFVGTLIISPALFLLAFVPKLSSAVNARRKFEYSQSFTALTVMYIIVAAVCWGYLGERMLVIACIMAWGPGDAAAALIGKKYGKHRLGKAKKKSLEGSLAMFAFSFISVFIVLMLWNKWGIVQMVIVTFLTALVTTVVEFYVLSGFDTFFCPVAAMTVLALSAMAI